METTFSDIDNMDVDNNEAPTSKPARIPIRDERTRNNRINALRSRRYRRSGGRGQIVRMVDAASMIQITPVNNENTLITDILRKQARLLRLRHEADQRSSSASSDTSRANNNSNGNNSNNSFSTGSSTTNRNSFNSSNSGNNGNGRSSRQLKPPVKRSRPSY